MIAGIELGITDILNPSFIHKWTVLTMGVDANTYPDGVRKPEGMRYLHIRDALEQAAQLPPCYIRALRALYDEAHAEKKAETDIQPGETPGLD